MSSFPFSKDKDQLIKTLARYDRSPVETEQENNSNIRVEDVTDSVKTRRPEKYQNTFFLHVLLEQVCETIEPDAEKRSDLFDAVCKRLTESNYMNGSLHLGSFMPLRRRLAHRFMEFVKQVQSEVVPNPTMSQISTDALFEDQEFSTKLQLQNKYDQNFEELEVIAKGGFGVVCKAKHKVDGNIYAVKKIIFKYKNDANYLKVIREAKSISTLNHLNVVSYNNAWMECLPISDSNVDSSSDSSTDTSSSEISSPEETSDDPLRIKDSISSSINKLKEFLGKENSFESSETLTTEKISLDAYHFSQHRSRTVFKESFSNDNSSSSVYFLSDSNEKVEKDDSKITFTKETKKQHHENQHADNETSERGSKIDWDLNSLNVKVMLCIQMEYCDCDLRLWLNERALGKKLPFQKDVMSIFKDIVHGVGHIHSKSIIHRDLKPQNIFYSKKNNVMKIGDFGLSTLAEYPPEKQNKDVVSPKYSANLGTWPYAAPEQIKQRSYDSKVDIYSLGIMLIELLKIFSTTMEFCKTIDAIKEGNIPDEMLEKWPECVHLVENLVKTNPKERMTAKELLDLPMFQDSLETVEILQLRRSLSEREAIIEARERALYEKGKEIESRERALYEKEKEMESRERALYEKEKEMKSRERALYEKKNEIESRERALAEKEKELESLVAREKEISAKEKTLLKKELGHRRRK